MSNAIHPLPTSTAPAWQDVKETLSPSTGAGDGVLPPLMALLTIAIGIVGTAAHLKLGHEFVANMTGNVVFFGFAAAGASGLSVISSFLDGEMAAPPGQRTGRGGLLHDVLAERRLMHHVVDVMLRSLYICLDRCSS